MGVRWSQFFPPKPDFGEIPRQGGKVFIVTGGSSGIGSELSKALYLRGGHVYIAGRSESKARAAIKEIEDAMSGKTAAGKLDFLHLELNDSASIKASVGFKSKETKLYIL